MVLYILSQLIGSTLALDYMRAEYVAPLGSTSLIFNFLFARFLIGTPVTQTDIYGTMIVVIGVIGIVAFGAVNSGLSTETDVNHLTALWQRGGWLAFFFCMSVALILVLIFTNSLDDVLAARSDLDSEPFAGMSARRPRDSSTTYLGKAKNSWNTWILWVKEKLETWTAPQGDTQVAWVLGIGWACCGGGLAGGCLVFAKATVKLLTGSLSHENPGNQFGHIAPIFTIILLVITAVLQIICLNRGLKVYDSTLVVPVFYGVYTATGFLDSLVFNNEVDAYKPWILFLIFASIMILISGVVLLTHKKPERSTRTPTATALSSLSSHKAARSSSKVNQIDEDDENDDEEQALRKTEEGEENRAVLWQVGDISEDEDDQIGNGHTPRGVHVAGSTTRVTGEGSRLMRDEEEVNFEQSRLISSDTALAQNAQDPFHDDDDEEFGQWK
jgi:drug/metabolite transporter (DMT)-like permease